MDGVDLESELALYLAHIQTQDLSKASNIDIGGIERRHENTLYTSLVNSALVNLRGSCELTITLIRMLRLLRLILWASTRI